MALTITPELLPFAQLALNNPDIAGLFAAAEESGAGGAGGGLSFTGNVPAGALPQADMSNIFGPPAAPAAGATPPAEPNGLGLALSGVQALQPGPPVMLPPPQVNVGRGFVDSSPLLQMLLQGRGGASPSLGQLISGR